MVVFEEVLRAELVAGVIGVAVACEYGTGLHQCTRNCGTLVLSEAADDVRCKAARIYSRLENEVIRKPGSQ